MEYFRSNIFIGGWTISSNSLSANGIAINSNGSIKATNNRWSINSDGTATFYNVISNIGTIAGWHITEDDIYNDYGTHLNSQNEGGYSIITSSIDASGGRIGGCTITENGINGANWSLSASGGSIGGWNIT